MVSDVLAKYTRKDHFRKLFRDDDFSVRNVKTLFRKVDFK